MDKFKILQHLKSSYPQKVDLLEYFLEKYPDADVETLKEIASILKWLRDSNGLIETDTQDFKNLGQSETFDIPNERVTYNPFTLDHLKYLKEIKYFRSAINSKITIDGLKELENEILRKQALELNESVKATNHSVQQTNFWTPWIAGLAALFSLIALVKDWNKSLLIEPTLQRTIERQASALDSLQQTLRDIDSSLHRLNEKAPDSLLK